MTISRCHAAGTLAALAVVSLSASPAFARGPDGWQPYRTGSIGMGALPTGSAGAALIGQNNEQPVDDQPEGPARYRYPGGPATDAQEADNAQGDDGDYGDASEGDVPSEDRADDAQSADQGYEARSDDDTRSRGDREPNRAASAEQGRFGEAVDACTDELGRGDKQVESIGGVRRIGGRYNVEGQLQDGRPYACSVDEEGRVRSVAVDGQAMI